MKKFKIIIVLVTLFGLNCYSQIQKGIIKSSPNFFEIQKAFYENYKSDTSESESIDGEKDDEFEKFKRWEWYWEQRVGISGEFPPANVLLTEWDKYSQAHPKLAEKTTSTTASWTFKGPTSSTGSLAGYVGVGRVNCIAFHPSIANTFWVGTPAGGLWKTTDGGSTWSTNTDYFPTLGISDIAINPLRPTTMYVATGDGDMGGGNLAAIYTGYPGSGDTKSQGILKSTDGGSSWSYTGLYWTDSFQVLTRRLVMDPSDTSVLLAATSWGIYRTANGGTTWTGEAGGWFTDLQFDPANHNIVYATTYNHLGGAQICRSTDNGVTWFYVTSFTGVTRIKLAVTPAWPSLVYALTVNTNQGCEGLYWSVDNGATFTQQWAGDCTFNLLSGHFDASGCNGQGNYDLAFAMNPTNAGIFFVGGVNTWKTSDTGSIWYLQNFWHDTTIGSSTILSVHGDKHWLAYHPLASGTLFECNDGGLYKTTDGGTTWTNLSSGLGISEIYRIGTSATVVNKVICGLQDNGSKEYSGGTWNNRTGGDGTECIIDYSNANIQYASYVKGVIYKTTNDWVSSSTIVASSGTGVNSDGQWVTPYLMHPTNHNTLIVGKSQVYQTTDGGSTWAQLGTISGATGQIRAMAYSPSSPTTIYVAYNASLYKTTDGGTTWTGIATSSSNYFTYIAVESANPLSLWVTKSGYTPGDKVYHSSDGGATWSNWTGSLSNVPVNCVVYQNYGCGGIFVGTDLGVYFYGHGLTDWTSFNTGLPNVVVNELEISYNNNKLWAATFGRGLWNTDLYFPTCPVPGTLSASGITTSSATLNWGAVSAAIHYNIHYRQTGTGTWTSTTSTTTSVSVTGLSECTTYEFQVQTVDTCADTSLYSSSATFTTSAPVCGVPSGLTATSITTTSATLNWSIVTGVISYNIHYRQIGTGTWSSTTSGTTSVAISGLLPCTDYEFQVQAGCICSTSSAFSSSTNFTTLTPTCGIPSSLSATSITPYAATLNWSAVTGATNYTIQYRQTGTVTWSTTTSPITSVTISGLTPATSYDYEVEASCICSTTSSYSGISNFTSQDNTNISNQQVNSGVEIYPNPTKGLFTIELSNLSNVKIEVTDLLGQVIINTVAKGNKTILDLSNRANGIYLVKINSIGFTATKKILLER